MTVRPPLWIDAVQVAGTDMRLGTGTALTAPSGLLRARSGSLGGPILVTAQSTPNMTVTVPPFVAVIDGAGSGTGAAIVTNDGPVTLTVGASSSTNPRIDLVVVSWVGEGSSAGSRGGKLTVVAGTAAAVPVAPALPANALLLATVAVAKSATTIGSAAITNAQRQTSAVGGLTPSRNAADVAAAYAGQTRLNMTTGEVEWSRDGRGWEVTGDGTRTAVITMANGWADGAPSNFQRLLLQRDYYDRVTLSGVMYNTLRAYATGPTHDAVVPFTLPAGFAPREAGVFYKGGLSTGGTFDCDIQTNGIVQIVRTLAPGGSDIYASVPQLTLHSFHAIWSGG